jgi:hypothetical protein
MALQHVHIVRPMKIHELDLQPLRLRSGCQQLGAGSGQLLLRLLQLGRGMRAGLGASMVVAAAAAAGLPCRSGVSRFRQ